ncbi:MAG: CPBP family intramembrane glutamic endopeptidase [Verrucomicrobiota bacterium]
MMQTGNPYRAVLRREYPEPLIALLAFILGIWLWDHYFGKPDGYAPGTETVALVKMDRDLRLADAMVDDPAWLKFLVGVDSPVVARRDALLALRSLGEEDSMTLKGLEAYSVILAVQDQQPIEEAVASSTQGRVVLNPDQAIGELADHRGTWWQTKVVDVSPNDASQAAMATFAADSAVLRSRAIVARSLVWLVGVIGLAFVPVTLRRMKSGMHGLRGGYGGAWSLRFGLVIFLVATLAWIGFNLALEVGIGGLPGLHPALALALDSAARLMPMLIALGLIFRKPSHVVRVMGLAKKPDLQTVLGTFSLLMLLDQGLRQVLAPDPASNPGGGLSMTEAGPWGLVFALVASCLLAPVAEEILYRGVLFRSVRNRLGVLAGGVISSLIFALLHFYDGYGLVSVGIFGLSCALAYAATGTLTTAIALHVLYNFAIKMPEWIVYHAPLE